MAKINKRLSKTLYLDALKCDLLLWYSIHHPRKVDSMKDSYEIHFEEAIKVHELARKLYPAGRLINWDDTKWNDAIEQSRQGIRDRTVLFEAGFQYDNLFCRTDILVPYRKNQWDLIEVKSTTSVKDEHLQDLAFQYYILQNIGLSIHHTYLIHIHSDYIKQGDIQLDKFFIKEDLTELVLEQLDSTKYNIDYFTDILHSDIPPDFVKSHHCDSPKQCIIPELCWAFLPPRHVYFLYGDRNRKLSSQLMANKIYALKDIPAEFRISMTSKQRIQLMTEQNFQPYVNKSRIRQFLNKLQYPYHFLDFETIATAIPKFDLSRPYEQIPFQYSLHIKPKPGGEIIHHAYLSDGQTDPRPILLSRLKNELAEKGSIIAYSSSFEINVLKKSVNYYPEYQIWLKDILPRFVDLLAPFRSFHYYHPYQDGSASLKGIMPILGEREYDHLMIQQGAQASYEFLQMAFTPMPEKDKLKIRRALELYCKQDTEGLIDIIKNLESLSTPSVSPP